MTGRRPRARRAIRRAALGIAFATVGSTAWPQSTSTAAPIAGFPAGPLMLAPSLTTGYAYNSNVYQQSETFDPTGDEVLTVQPALQLTVPFSNSAFTFADTFSFVDYKKTAQLAGKNSNDAKADLALRFASLDTLELSAHHLAGVAETLAFDPGGETKFRGNSYSLHTETVSTSREIDGVRGYRAFLSRNALTFDQSTVATFIDYRGFEGEGAYLEPLSASTRLAVGYFGSRYDQYETGPGSDPALVFRTERGNGLYAELEGLMGSRQPYQVRLGWQKLDFGGDAASRDFSGLVGQAQLAFVAANGFVATVFAQRQPFRSTVANNNFYVFHQLGTQIERRLPLGSNVGGNVSLSQNDYSNPAPDDSIAPGVVRRDRIVRLEAYANLKIADYVVFRVSLLRDRKYSNFPGADFKETVLFGGFVLGWM